MVLSSYCLSSVLSSLSLSLVVKFWKRGRRLLGLLHAHLKTRSTVMIGTATAKYASNTTEQATNHRESRRQLQQVRVELMQMDARVRCVLLRY